MGYHLIRLENGIRVLLNRQASTITHTCLIVNVGSRDEQDGKFGMAHFIEHLLFKQTDRRNTNQILNRLESVGGDINAYTTKEYTCIHASVLKPYLNRALDLFEDITFHSTFPESEMTKEKGVILDEMASYLDSPEESIMDDFDDLLFAGTGLGHNILGLEKDLLSISRQDVKDFIAQNYTAEDIAIGISGDYTPKEIERMVGKLFTFPLREKRPKNSSLPELPSPIHRVVHKPINQVHYALGIPAFGIHDSRKTALMLLNNMLGGIGMSSILNLSIREKHGIAYTIESSYVMYADTGIFSIYLGTDEEKMARAKRLVRKELDKLMIKPISEATLNKAKHKFKGQIALAEENRMSVIIAETKNILDYGAIITLEDVFHKINAVSTTDVHEIASDLFAENRMSSLSFFPED